MDTPSPLQPRHAPLEPCDAPLTGKISAPHVPLSFPLLLALDIAFQQQQSPRNPTSPQSVHHASNPHNASPTTSPGAPRRASTNKPIRKDAPQPSPRSPLSARKEGPRSTSNPSVQSMQAPLGQVPSVQRRSSTQHAAAAPSMMLLLPLPGIPGVAAPLPSGGRGPPNPLLRIPRERTPQQQIKQQFLSQLLYYKDGSLRGGTLQKVLVHIAFVVVDAELTDCFLHGYRRYCGPDVLLKELRTAYQNRLDMSLILPESIHDAYFCFLWEWIDLYYEQDFANLAARAQLLDSLDPLPKELRNRLVLFILRCVGPPALNSMLQPRSRPASPHPNVHAKAPPAAVAATLSLPAGITMTQTLAIRESNTIRKRSASVGHATKRFSVSLFSYFGINNGDYGDDELPATKSSDAPPPPLSPAPLSGPSASRSASLLLTCRLEDLARQLTMIEFEMYNKVQASEFQDNAWQAADKHVRAPFLTAMVSFSNKVTAWLAQEILRHPTGGLHQVEALERAVRLTEKCRELHNYNAQMECHLATSQTSIERLKITWSKVDEKVRAMHANHEELLTPVGNFRRFRDEIRAASDQSELPVLPYIGTFLRDVLFANDGNPNTLVESKQLLNWNKFQIVGNQINYWNKFKRYRFQFPLDLSLQQQLLSLPAVYDGEK